MLPPDASPIPPGEASFFVLQLMPYAAPKPCGVCGVLVRDGTSRCAKHPALGRFSDSRRGTRQERGYGTAWDKLRRLVLDRDSGLCVPCRSVSRITQAVAVDHVVPKARGGDDDLANLQAICLACHRAKTGAEAHGRVWAGPGGGEGGGM